MKNKKLCNLLNATQDDEAVNLKVLNEKFEVFKQDIANLVDGKLRKIDEKVTQLDQKMHEEFTSVNQSSNRKYE